MNQAEWLSSTSPQEMLAAVGDVGDHPDRTFYGAVPLKASERKLRLFACACMRLSGIPQDRCDEVERDGPPALEGSEQHTDAEFALAWTERGGGKPPDATKANLLRCIVGDPFAPMAATVTCHACGGCGKEGPCGLTDYYRTCWTCGEAGGRGKGPGVLPAPWLTPQVVSLARMAYSDRLPDGALDPLTLAAVADALEEAGCPAEDEVIFTCDNAGRHSHDGRAGQVIHGVLHEGDPRKPHHHHDEKCQVIRREGLLTHLRSAGSHVRGCWATDLILGKS